MAKAQRARSWTVLEKEIVRCHRCPRLVDHREEVARVKRRAYLDDDYWGKPVPSFGDHRVEVFIVGLAPGAHGANRTGRMFTGDSSGDFLFRALYEHGLANQPECKHRRDGLKLHRTRITNVVRCVPPGNRPVAAEVEMCRGFFYEEMRRVRTAPVVIALGKVAWDEVLRLWRDPEGPWASLPESPPPRFAHGAEWTCPDRTLIGSYHPSRQNTQTGRLTRSMFARVFQRANEIRGIS